MTEVADSKAERRRTLFPGLPDDLRACAGILLAHDLISWLDARCVRLSSLSAAKGHDPGATSVLDYLIANGFEHIVVPDGKDEAERALLHRMRSFSTDPARHHVSAGSGDHRMLGWLESRLRTHTIVGALAIVPSYTSCSPDQVRALRRSAARVVSLEELRRDQHETRRGDSVARLVYRQQVLSLSGLFHEAATRAYYALGTLCTAIARLEMPTAEPEELAAALRDLSAGAADVEMLIEWLRHGTPSILMRDEEHARALLFTGAVLVTIGEADFDARQLMFAAVARARQESLGALYRGLQQWVS